jgi:nitrate reductase gamma subunit
VLAYRRVTIARIRAATPRSDIVLYPLLVVTMLLGLAAALGENFLWGEYHYRETVSPWFRGVLTLDRDRAPRAALARERARAGGGRS